MSYSYETSLPAYKSNDKQKQAEAVLSLIKTGCNTLLELSEKMNLPQSTVSGRVNDLIQENKVEYFGKKVYKNYTRKVVRVRYQEVLQQKELFC